VEELRQTIGRLAANERRLRAELEAERGSHEADVTRLEGELEAQAERLAESRQQARELRSRLATPRGGRIHSIRRRIAKS
jgi:hypothetical protein